MFEEKFGRYAKKNIEEIHYNKTDIVRITKSWGVFMQPLLQWKSKEYFTTRVYVFVALGIQYAMRIRHIVNCGLPRSAIFLNIIS